MHKSLFLTIIILLACANFAVQAQTPQPSPTPAANMGDIGIKTNLALGEVTIINQVDNKISLSTKDGAIDVVLSANTIFKRVPPENPKLSAAADSTLSDIGIGDKILVTGMVASDKKSIPAKAIYLMRKADITKKNEAERGAWKTRGISGRIVSLNPQTQEFTIATRGMAGEQNVTVSAKEKADYRRYAPDSVKFDEAKLSNFSELKVGDQIRALGDKSADNASFKAERIVSGSFKMVGGTVTAIDAAKNEITIKDILTNKPVTVVVNSGSILKKFPAEFAQMMATRMQGGGMQPPTQSGNVTVRPPRTNPNGQTQTPPNGAGQGTGMRGGRGDFDEMLERFQTISLADLKVGDAIAVSSTTGASVNRVTAIKLLSGVEPLLNASQAGGAQRGGAQQGGQGGFNIPGLDGIGTP